MRDRLHYVVGTAAFVSAIGAFAWAPANAGWFGYSNAKECYLEKMKGLPENMQSLVYDECLRSYGAKGRAWRSAYADCMKGEMLLPGIIQICIESATSSTQ